MDREQSIFCVSNISNEIQTLEMSDLNLIDTENWFDLISREIFDEKHQIIKLNPYQTVWITNLQPTDDA
jgi:sucrose phosphorylase